MEVLKQELHAPDTYIKVDSTEASIVERHVKTGIDLKLNITPDYHKLPVLYWIPKLHKNPYKTRFISNATNTTTTSISKCLTSCLTEIKSHVKKYCTKVYENSGLNLFWSIKDSGEVLSKLHSIKEANLLSTYDFSTLYTTLPHDLIKTKLRGLIEKTFAREKCTFIACGFSNAFFTDLTYEKYTMWTCEDVCSALDFLLDNIFVRHGHAIYRQNIGIPMGTNCAPLIADLFLYCYERDFMLGLAKDGDTQKIDAFNKTSRYLDDILNIDNPFFPNLYKNIYPSQLKLNLASTCNTRTSFLDLDISIEQDIITTKIYDKRDDFDFYIVNFPYLDSDVPRAPAYGIYMSQLVRYARACTKVDDFNERNLFLTNKLLRQGYLFHKLRRTFAKFYHRNKSLLHKFNSNLKTFLTDGVAHPEFYSDVINKLRKIKGKDGFNNSFIKIIKKFHKRGYKLDTLRLTTYEVLDPYTVDNYHFLFACTAT